MRKIAVVSWYFPVREEPYRGHSAYQTLRRLRDLVDVEVLCPQPYYSRWLQPRTFRNFQTDLSYAPPDVKVKYFRYPVFPVISRPINGIVCAHYVEPYLRAANADVILNYKVYPEGYAAASLGQKYGIPVVLTGIGSDLNRISDPFSRAQIVKALKRATLVTTVSEHLRQQAIRLGAHPESSRAILNGCDTELFYPRDRAVARRSLDLPVDAPVILFVGRLDVLKGVIELVQAFSALEAELENLFLVLVGEGPAQGEIEKIAGAARVRDRVRIVKPCPSEKVAEWMAAADIFTLPSYAEGCPNVVVEALHCGRPVVATAVGGIPELVGDHNGELVPPRDAAALAGALRSTLARSWDPLLVAKRAERSWGNVAREVYDACEWAIERNRRASAKN